MVMINGTASAHPGTEEGARERGLGNLRVSEHHFFNPSMVYLHVYD